MRAHAFIMLYVAALLAACGKSPTAPSPQGLPGTWKATRAEYVSRTNASVRVEIVSRGTTLVLTLNANNTYTLAITDPGQTGQVLDGTWSSSSEVLTLKQSGTSGDTQFNMALSGNTLTLSGGHVLFDIENDGIPDEATLTATFVRQ
jgi:hypothetical protein